MLLSIDGLFFMSACSGSSRQREGTVPLDDEVPELLLVGVAGIRHRGGHVARGGGVAAVNPRVAENRELGEDAEPRHHVAALRRETVAGGDLRQSGHRDQQQRGDDEHSVECPIGTADGSVVPPVGDIAHTHDFTPIIVRT